MREWLLRHGFTRSPTSLPASRPLPPAATRPPPPSAPPRAPATKASSPPARPRARFDAALLEAINRLSGLRDELQQLIGDANERWYAFGFDKPSDPETPEVPENVVVTPGPAGSGTVNVDWPDARRSESYRVIVRNTTQLGEIIVEDSDASFTGLTSGMPVVITVSARNGRGGESAASAPVPITVP